MLAGGTGVELLAVSGKFQPGLACLRDSRQLPLKQPLYHISTPTQMTGTALSQ